jgi:ribokinase
MKPEVLVVGSYVQDLTFFTRRFPRTGETTVGDFRTGCGGKGFNQAVAARRAGARTVFVGAVGHDAFAVKARKFAAAERLPVHLVEKPRVLTGAAGITVDEAGQNQIVVSLGANQHLRSRDVPAPLLGAARVVVCQGESDYTTVAQVLRTARRNGATTVLNPAPMRPDFDPALLRHTDILIPNETEFVALAHQLRKADGRTLTADSLARLPADKFHTLCRSFGVPVVIVTLGARGCFVSEPDVYLRITAHTVEAIDTTGAGDAFVGGFAAGLVKFKNNVFEAAHYANAVAAISVTHPGTADSMPTSREILRFLRRRDHA